MKKSLGKRVILHRCGRDASMNSQNVLSVLGPLLFNIYLNDYDVENANVCNFADDTTPHTSGYNLKVVMIDVEHDCTILVE